MRRPKPSLALAVALCATPSLLGCGQQLGETTCSSPGAVDVTKQLISDQVEKVALAKSKQADGTYAVSPSNIRAAIALLRISIDDIRTTKSDPNSTKRFCTGTAKVVFPLNAIDDADKARTIGNLPGVNNLADASNVQRQADAFTFSIDYDVQPTDDRKSIFAESDSINPQIDFVSEVLESDLLLPTLQSQQQAQQQQAQQQAALQAQASQAALKEATDDNNSVTQEIKATWAAIDPVTRRGLLDGERTWIASTAANCNMQAAAASTDPTDQQTARLKCLTAANQARNDWLKQYLTSSGD